MRCDVNKCADVSSLALGGKIKMFFIDVSSLADMMH